MGLEETIRTNTLWYRNCLAQRKSDAKMCKGCPFRNEIEEMEMELEYREDS